MPKLVVYNTKGEKQSTLSLPEKIFAAPVNPQLMAQAVRVYLSNQRQARAKTKSRGEVAISTRKIYRQKGTGRARHGSRNAPIFVGGGIAHGPRGNQNYRLRLPKKMKRKALFSALTAKLQDKKILAVKGLEKLEPKTKHFHQLFLKLFKKQPPRHLLLVLPQPLSSVTRGARNLPFVQIVSANQLNTYQVLRADSLVFMPETIKALKETFLSQSPSSKTKN